MEKFQSLNEWLNEEAKKKPQYGCVMLDAHKLSDWDEKHIGGIDPKDVYNKPSDDSYGLEDNPHITILYGIHEDEIDPEVPFGVIQNELAPVTVTVDEIGVFENPEFDVVKYEIPVTDELLKYREKFEKRFSNTQKFDGYHPHMTLAYVKPGEGKKYAKKLEEPFEVTFGKGVYSFHDDEGELVRKQHVFPVDEKPDEIDNEVTSPFTSDNE